MINLIQKNQVECCYFVIFFSFKADTLTYIKILIKWRHIVIIFSEPLNISGNVLDLISQQIRL